MAVRDCLELQTATRGTTARRAQMEETGEKSTTSLTREGVADRKRRTNSQHVELVIARIFAKEREYMEQRSFRSRDVEEFATDRR